MNLQVNFSLALQMLAHTNPPYENLDKTSVMYIIIEIIQLY